jgi:hypothetical protein
MEIQVTEFKKIELDDGKYAIVQAEEKPGPWQERYEILRNDEHWDAYNRDLVGNKFLHSLLDLLFEQQAALEKIHAAHVVASNAGVYNHSTEAEEFMDTVEEALMTDEEKLDRAWATNGQDIPPEEYMPVDMNDEREMRL